MICHKAHDPLLDASEIVIGLRDTDHDSVQAHRMDRHGGRRSDHAFLCRNSKRHADGVAAAKHQRDVWLFHTGDQFSNRETGLYIAAHRIEQDQKALHLRRFLDRRNQRQDMLVFCRFCILGQHLMPFDLTHNGQTVNIPLAACAQFFDFIHKIHLPVSLTGRCAFHKDEAQPLYAVRTAL